MSTGGAIGGDERGARRERRRHPDISEYHIKKPETVDPVKEKLVEKLLL